MDDTVDLLQIKIDQAKKRLPPKTLAAIDAVPWQAEILKMRETKGYTFDQLGALELETELLLCGLINSKDYSKELESRMNISKTAVNELVLEMNKEVFSKIKEELIRSTERENSSQNQAPIKINVIKPVIKNTIVPEIKKEEHEALGEHGIEIVPEKLELPGKFLPAFVEKLSASVKVPVAKTEHSLDSITKNSLSAPLKPSAQPGAQKAYPKNGDPYRMIPE
jgi:hypothetical protein